MELVFNPTRRITTAEMFITCEPALEFEARVSVSRPTRRLMAQFVESEYGDTGLAEQIIGAVFVSVAQNGSRYPLDTPGAIEELREATGDDFMLALAGGFVDNHYGFFTRDKADSGS